MSDCITLRQDSTNLPVALLEFPKEMLPPPRAWLPWKYTQILTHNKASHGGHFAALEQPEALTNDLRAFITVLEEKRSGIGSFLAKAVVEMNKDEKEDKEGEMMDKVIEIIKSEKSVGL